MTDEEEMTPLYVEVPAWAKEVVMETTEHGGLTRVVREALLAVARGDSAVAEQARYELRQELAESKRARIDALKQQYQPPAVAEPAVRDSIAEVHELARANHQHRQRGWDDATPADRIPEEKLVEIEEALRGGMYVFPEHGKVQKAAVPGVTPEEVIEVLKDRNPDVPEHAFNRRNESEWAWKGVEAE